MFGFNEYLDIICSNFLPTSQRGSYLCLMHDGIRERVEWWFGWNWSDKTVNGILIYFGIVNLKTLNMNEEWMISMWDDWGNTNSNFNIFRWASAKLQS